mmetsp:Transcript_12923/g.19573  ORF Transcript_12923/g.19573 Transcript_12923/m.19573 type:complete len:256 (+) Transcript_12923:49-816(+)|eukprot:CAMPEP_0206428092 /NCGR_PEP_ID=MMETSP0324_2-20121206/5443_1 /ASSEMBLY_ACC=CAM_ASM_000836 /TAXON_ID=2866 /ORGANISM="Crypthecodinium cohnii, Strain Seligo" /LENGTH=255 /DNA_ID=CAMNT_0053893523 /DNA_START=91 /DNA_END=858 /DNA_ORIENTATION=+
MEGLSHFVNPLQVSLPLWLAAVALKEASLQGIIDPFVNWLGSFVDPLPTRQGPKPATGRPLDYKDYAFLVINAFIETVFLCHLAVYVVYDPSVERSLSGLAILNGPVALYLVIIFNDLLYAPFHRMLHIPALYKHIHKHHHRILYPFRGSMDARNEHPVEQVTAMGLWFAAYKMATACVGIHALAVLVHTTLMVLGTGFNHTGFDVNFRILGIEFSVRAHEMHHRKPNSNYGQLCMWFDHLMGTYVPYVAGAIDK